MIHTLTILYIGANSQPVQKLCTDFWCFNITCIYFKIYRLRTTITSSFTISLFSLGSVPVWTCLSGPYKWHETPAFHKMLRLVSLSLLAHFEENVLNWVNLGTFSVNRDPHFQESNNKDECSLGVFMKYEEQFFSCRWRQPTAVALRRIPGTVFCFKVIRPIFNRIHRWDKLLKNAIYVTTSISFSSVSNLINCSSNCNR